MRVVSATTPDFLEYRKRIKSAQHLDKISGIAAYEEAMDEVLDVPWQLRGSPLPWSKTARFFRIRPNELTLWAGKNAHGKSALLLQVMGWLASGGEPVMIASFEMPVTSSLERMIKQATGVPLPAKSVRQRYFAHFREKVYFYDHEGLIQPDLVLDLCQFSGEVLGCKHVVIDSLTKIQGMVGENNELQATFVNALHTTAKRFGVHVHLVAHERKGGHGSESNISGRFEIKGSGAIPDQVDNCIMVWQNKANLASEEPDQNEPDVILTVDKQRHGMWTGRVALYFAENENWQCVQQRGLRFMQCPGFTLDDESPFQDEP